MGSGINNMAYWCCTFCIPVTPEFSPFPEGFWVSHIFSACFCCCWGHFSFFLWTPCLFLLFFSLSWYLHYVLHNNSCLSRYWWEFIPHGKLQPLEYRDPQWIENFIASSEVGKIVNFLTRGHVLDPLPLLYIPPPPANRLKIMGALTSHFVVTSWVHFSFLLRFLRIFWGIIIKIVNLFYFFTRNCFNLCTFINPFYLPNNNHIWWP